MKKMLFTSFLFLVLISASAQVTLENIYNYSGNYTNLAVSGPKFFLMDVGLSQCRIYNTDHTSWKTINLSVPAGNYLYDIKYVSEGLFTTDNALCLAFVYYYYDETNAYYTFNAKIVRENGTELLTIPGCQYLNAVDLGNDGFKLLAYSYDYSVSPYTMQTRVYSLPGQMTGTEEVKLPGINQLPFPNPASSYTSIPYKLPEGISVATLSVVNMQGAVVDRLQINRNAEKVTLPTGQYPAGTYVFSIEHGNTRIGSGKFSVNGPGLR